MIAVCIIVLVLLCIVERKYKPRIDYSKESGLILWHGVVIRKPFKIL